MRITAANGISSTTSHLTGMRNVRQITSSINAHHSVSRVTPNAG